MSRISATGTSLIPSAQSQPAGNGRALVPVVQARALANVSTAPAQKLTSVPIAKAAQPVTQDTRRGQILDLIV